MTLPVPLIERVVIGNAGLTITTTLQDQTGKPLAVHSPWQPEPARRRREIIPCERSGSVAVRPMRTEAYVQLVPALAQAHAWLDELIRGKVALVELAQREKVSGATIRNALSLAFVAPDCSP